VRDCPAERLDTSSNESASNIVECRDPSISERQMVAPCRFLAKAVNQTRTLRKAVLKATLSYSQLALIWRDERGCDIVRSRSSIPKRGTVTRRIVKPLIVTVLVGAWCSVAKLSGGSAARSISRRLSSREVLVVSLTIQTPLACFDCNPKSLLVTAISMVLTNSSPLAGFVIYEWAPIAKALSLSC